MKLLVLDNYDSFTYNLVYMLREMGLGDSLDVYRNDAISLDAAATYDAFLLSPGPGIPREAGFMPRLIQRFGSEKPMLGVCLGHQAIGEAYGAKLQNLSEVFHGVASEVLVSTPEDPLFKDLPSSFTAGRYHSWVVEKEGFPDALQMLATDSSGTVMALRHRELPLYGLQFHPESILSEHGQALLANWIDLVAHFNSNRKRSTV